MLPAVPAVSRVGSPCSPVILEKFTASSSQFRRYEPISVKKFFVKPSKVFQIVADNSAGL
jgi:hypothetical protein